MVELDKKQFQFVIDGIVKGMGTFSSSMRTFAQTLVRVQPLTIPSSNFFYQNFSNPFEKEKTTVKEHERAVLMAAMFEAGLLPIEAGEAGLDMRRVLAQLPPEEAHKMKRKFRKVWRKLAEKAVPDKRRQKFVYGSGEKQPSRNARRNRKELVHAHFIKTVVNPVIEKFESGVKPSGGQDPTKS